MNETTETPRRPGIYSRGTQTVDQILAAALRILIDEGAAAFTLRRIAAECGLKVGNVSYHFPRKELLIQLMLDELLDSYEQVLALTVRAPGKTAEERLAETITLCLDDIGTKRSTRLFTELWALANQNAFVAERVETFYRHVHRVIGDSVRALNPALDDADVATLSLFISAAMEGTTPFAGFEKPWAHEMPALRRLSLRALVHLAKTATTEEIRGLAPSASAG